jgi:hypothetical protein
MIAGVAFYQALHTQDPLFQGGALDRVVAIVTFPHAISCALAGRVVSAREKRTERPDLLRCIEIEPVNFGNIDEVDAALCAVAARTFATNTFKTFGESSRRIHRCAEISRLP